MFYRYSLTIPADTTQEDSLQIPLYLSYGIVHQVELGFPPGCAGLVHASIWHLEHQAWPSNPDHNFGWDDYNIRIINEHFPLLAPPYFMTLRAWNDDTIYPHTIVCRLGLKVPEPHRPGSWIGYLLTGETPE